MPVAIVRRHPCIKGRYVIGDMPADGREFDCPEPIARWTCASLFPGCRDAIILRHDWRPIIGAAKSCAGREETLR